MFLNYLLRLNTTSAYVRGMLKKGDFSNFAGYVHVVLFFSLLYWCTCMMMTLPVVEYFQFVFHNYKDSTYFIVLCVFCFRKKNGQFYMKFCVKNKIQCSNPHQMFTVEFDGATLSKKIIISITSFSQKADNMLTTIITISVVAENVTIWVAS